MDRVRIDRLLVERGLAASRERARRLVMAGGVLVGERPVTKPGAEVAADAEVRLRGGDSPYVSRGGEKLAGALDAFGLAVRDLVALDVGYGQLAWKLRQDSRVVVIERTNARRLTPAMLPEAPELAVVDVSFISLATVLPAIAGVLTPGGTIVALVKPQFEVGRGRVGKGGVVRDPALRAEAVASVRAAAARLGLAVKGEAESILPGPKGNREVFVWLARS